MSHWLALVIGNTRLHWALFEQDMLLAAWHSPYLSQQQIQNFNHPELQFASWQAVIAQTPTLDAIPFKALPELWIASVVPQQTADWQEIPAAQFLENQRIPLQGVYATLGLDRLLTLWGAGLTYGWPALVIDAGTAVTFTAGVEGRFIGGAILPGLSLQLKALTQHTAALPAIALASQAPERWATNTVEAMQSGVFHTVLAGVLDYCRDWQQRYPESRLILTGGDGERLYTAIQHRTPGNVFGVRYDANLMFWGIRAYRALAQGRDLTAIG
jgi:type III pantothenate kinase